MIKQAHNRYLLAALLLISLSISCKISSIKAIQKGRPALDNYQIEIPTSTISRLLIFPVEIKGKTYKFLFDTGAPTSISKKIQEIEKFKVISKGTIKDTDRNRSSVNYVEVDSLLLGDMIYIEQTAFVTDFTSNPVLNCLELDGIIGSNTIRQSNWIIDEKANKAIITNGSIIEFMQDHKEIPFSVDQQYNMDIHPKMGRAKLSNISVDYGSNGGLSLPKEIYKKLKDASVLDSSYTLVGKQQSGLFGESVSFNKEIGRSDSLILAELQIPKVEISESSSALLGTKVLLQYKVGIDWSNRKLYLQDYDEQNFEISTFGISFGTNLQKKPVILAVSKDGLAYKKGVRSDMLLQKINGISMSEAENFCEFIELMNELPTELSLELIDAEGRELLVKIQKQTIE